MPNRTNRSSSHIGAGRRVHMHIAGMSCSDCVSRVRSTLAAIAGVRVIDVRPGSATVELDPGVGGSVDTALAAAGYEVIGWSPGHASGKRSSGPHVL